MLGPHAVPRDCRPDAWEVRVFQPLASGVEIVTGGTRVPAEKIHEAGFFRATLDRDPGGLPAVDRTDQGTFEFEDSYRFALVLGSMPLHLNAEGTLHDAAQLFRWVSLFFNFFVGFFRLATLVSIGMNSSEKFATVSAQVHGNVSRFAAANVFAGQIGPIPRSFRHSLNR